MLYDSSATTTDLSGARIDLALVPIGAIEQHSIHMPLGTDWIGATGMARRTAELLARERNVYLLPAFPFSLSQCHGPMIGTAWLKPETLADVLHDIVLSLYEQGIHRIAVINGHGGNFILDEEIRELNARFSDLIVVNAVAWDMFDTSKKPTGRVVGGDIHAGTSETSQHLFLNPEHVHSERIDYVPPVGREFLDYAFMSQISPDGIWGRPSLATAEAGEQSVRRSVANMARNILQAFDDIEALLRGGDQP